MERAVDFRVDSTWAGVMPGCWASIRAVRPATCGVAMEVPL